LLLHAFSRIDVAADGYRQDPYFYYLTGLENTVGAILAIEGKFGQSWLFLPSEPPFANRGLKPQVSPGPETAKQLGIDHVVDWSELEGFVAARATSRLPIYYVNDVSGFEEMPANLVNSKNPKAPLWVQVILDKWPSFEARESSNALNAVMNVQSAEELTVLRLAARATVIAFMAGMRAIHPGVSQRSVESTVDSACWGAHAHGVSFWPWAMAGENAVFPKPFTSLALYDHLNANMQTGDLVRLDVGCEWEHYIGETRECPLLAGPHDKPVGVVASGPVSCGNDSQFRAHRVRRRAGLLPRRHVRNHQGWRGDPNAGSTVHGGRDRGRHAPVEAAVFPHSLPTRSLS